MKIPKLLHGLLTLFCLSIFAAATAQAQGGTLFTVNHHGDTHDAAVGDGLCADASGNCTLRAAIQEANAAPFQDGINFALPVPSTIDLTLGELQITSNIYIAGPGARKLTVQRSAVGGTSQFRIFWVQYTDNAPLPATIRGMTIRNGRAAGDGGAVYINYSTTLQLTDVAITGNLTTGSGGAIFNAGTLRMSRSLISGNTAEGLYGGGIINIGRTDSIISNSTLTNNTGNQGGAIYNGGRLTLVNDTISHNTSSVNGSSVLNDSLGTVNVLNTVIGMDNSPTVSSLSGAFNSLGNNLITDARNSTGFVNGTNGDQVSDNNTINPLLGALADNGGQSDTRALLAGSPAVNAGSNCVVDGNCPTFPQGFQLSTDQRKLDRRGETAVDIGAFETNPPTIFFSIAFGAGLQPRNRGGGTLLILTNAATNVKQVRITNTFGSFRFSGLNFFDVYFLETKPKRAGERRGLSIFEFDNLPTFVPLLHTRERDGMTITLEKIK